MRVVDLGVHYPGETTAQHVNKHGQVVGSTMDPMHPFHWDAGNGFRDMGPVDGCPASGEDINDNGHIVGIIYRVPRRHGFVWDPLTGFQDLGRSPPLVDKSSRAWGINNLDQVVGAVGFEGRKRAFMWFRDRLTVFEPPPDLGPDSWAWGINDLGQVVGYSGSSSESGIRHACLWENGQAIDLGTLGGLQSEALAINNLGQVVGWSTTWWQPGVHAFLWENGKMHRLPEAPGAQSSIALDINNLGHVVGTSPSEKGEIAHACVWEGRVPVLLPPLHGSYCAANGINDLGLVVGQVKPESWYHHAALWSTDVSLETRRTPRWWY